MGLYEETSGSFRELKTEGLLPREFIYLIAEIKIQIENLERREIRSERDEEDLKQLLGLKKVLEDNLRERIKAK